MVFVFELTAPLPPAAAAPLIEFFFCESFYCCCDDYLTVSYCCWRSRILLNVFAFFVECTVLAPPEPKFCVKVVVVVLCFLSDAPLDLTFFSVLAFERMSLFEAAVVALLTWSYFEVVVVLAPPGTLL